MSLTDLIARLERHAANQEHAEGICRRAECEEADLYAKVAADLRAAADAVRLVGECREVIEMARQQFGSHAGEGQREEECEQLLASIADWEGKHGQ